jgi:hypothetical protein
MKPESAKALAWTSGILSVLGLVVMSPSAAFMLLVLAAFCAAIPSVFAAKRTRIASVLLLIASIALAVGFYPDFEREKKGYSQRARQKAEAQPPEPLPTLIVQLQKTPQDAALRERVIRLASEARPAPAIPPAALQHESAGSSMLGQAKVGPDYLAATREYEQALRLAPWVARWYLGLGEAYEKAGDAAVANIASGAQPRQSCSSETQVRERALFDGYERARTNFEFYLLAKADRTEQDTAMIKRRIAERQLRLEKWRYQWNAACCLGCGGKQGAAK